MHTTYKIPLSKLKHIADPFYHKVFDSLNSYDLSHNLIENAIINQDIFATDEESIQNHIRKIAYMASNFNINDVVGMKLEQEQWVVTSGQHQLAAATYNKEKFILATLDADIKAIEQSFGTLTTVVPEKTKELLTFNWNQLNNSNNWDDIDFVLPQVQKVSRKNEDFKHVVASISDRLWFEHGDKIVNLCSHQIKYIPKHILASKELLSVIKNDVFVFDALWEEHYKKRYDEKSVEQKEINSLIKQELFDNKDFCLKYLKSTYSYDKFINQYQYFSDKVKIDPQIIDELYKKNETENRNLIGILPKQYFSDLENVKRFLKSTDNFYISPAHSYMYEHWVTDKNILMQFMKEKITSIASLHSLIPNRIKKDKDFILAYLPFNKHICDNLSASHFQDKDIFQAIVNQHCSDRIPVNIVFSLSLEKDKDLIIKIIQDESSFLNHDKTPPAWKKDIDVISSIPLKEIKWLSKELKKVYFSNEQNCINSLFDNPSNVQYFPRYMMKKEKVALAFLNNYNENNTLYDLNCIDPSLWSNYKFCSEALQHNIAAAKKIPNNFFNDQNFILDLAQNIDQHTINTRVFLYIPQVIKNVLDEHGVKDNYEQFFSTFFNKHKLKNLLEDKTVKKPRKI